MGILVFFVFAFFSIFSILLNIVYVYILNCFVLKAIECSDGSNLGRFINFFRSSLKKSTILSKLNIFNLDYIASRCSKEQLQEDVKKKYQAQKTNAENLVDRLASKRNDYIKYKNICNLGMSGGILVSTILAFWIGNYKVIFDDCLTDLILSFLFIRFISRALEIIFAFYNDIIDNKNDSKLKSDERLLLAIKSLFEIIIRSATIYLLIYTLKDVPSGNLLSNAISSVYLSILNSISFGSAYSSEIFDSCKSVCYCTGKCCCTDELSYIYEFIGKSVVVLQGVASFVLIILSFAKYLSGEEKNKKIIINGKVKVVKNKKEKLEKSDKSHPEE